MQHDLESLKEEWSEETNVDSFDNYTIHLGKGAFDAFVFLSADSITKVDRGVLVHELYHAMRMICRHRGIHDEETEAYILEYMYNSIMTDIEATEKKIYQGMSEEQRLLLRVLCSRLPYRMKVRTPFGDKTVVGNDVTGTRLKDEVSLVEAVVKGYKPLLRPMGSENFDTQQARLMHLKLSPDGTAVYKPEGISIPVNHYGEFVPYEFMERILNFLYQEQYDINHLIEKGLAIPLRD